MISLRGTFKNKHIMKKILALLVLVVAVSFQTNAQERKRQHRQGENLTAEQIATLASKKMTLGLDLTASQEKQVFKLLEAQAQDRIEMRTQRQEMRKNNERPSEEDKYNFKVAQLDKQIAFKTEMKKVLNDEQYEKWGKIMARKNHQKGKKGPEEGRRNHGKKGK